MKKTLLFAGVTLALLSACTKKSDTVSTSSAVLTAGQQSMNSCSSYSYYDTLSDCRINTYAVCSPTTVTISGSSATCYQPAANFQLCTVAGTIPNWVYTGWSGWCVDASAGAGVWKRTRTATSCDRHGLSQCDCVFAPITVEQCSVGGGAFPACTGSLSAMCPR